MSRLVSRVASFALGASLFAIAAVPSVGIAREKPAKEASAEAPKASKEFMPLAQAMDKALKAEDYPALDAAIAKAAPAASTPGDKYFLGFYTLRAGIAAKDTAKQAAGLDLLIESPATPAKDLAPFYFFSGNFAYQGGDYAKAISRLTKAQELGSQEPGLQEMLLEAYFKGDQVDAGLALAKQLVARDIAAGRKPADVLFVRQAQVLQRADRDTELIDVLAQRVAAYPTKENWRNSIVIMLQQLPNDKEMTLDSLRLLRAAGGMTGRAEYLEYAQLASDEGLPGEATDVVKAGRDAKIVPETDTTFNEIFKAQSARIAADKASLSSAEGDAAKASTAKIAASGGDALFGYGEYARAIAVYQTAMTKTGADVDTLNMRIGMAQALSGQNSAAVETLAKVKGMRAPLARFWSAYAQSKMAPPAAEAAPAA